jgi:pimeloyl-ACP methyl ester carboxylesterase
MSIGFQVEKRSRPGTVEDGRDRLLAELPVGERRLELAGISTAVLEGGEGPPVVLLHGPGDFAGTWMRVIPDLASTHRVVAPDLPGHGSSEMVEAKLGTERVLAWLGDLIDRTCPVPPALVGHALGGAIAARFAASRGNSLSRLVLVDPLGLGRFRPAPRFALSLFHFLARPTANTQDRLIRQCVVDLDGLREEMGASWEQYATYRLDRARTAGQKAALRSLMPQFGVPAIPAADLARIPVPTTVIRGRHDRVTRVRVAEGVSARHGWSLRFIEDAGADPAVEQPDAFLGALRAALGPTEQEGSR